MVSPGEFGKLQSSERGKQFLLYYWIVSATFLGFKAAVFLAARPYAYLLSISQPISETVQVKGSAQVVVAFQISTEGIATKYCL